MPNRWPTIIFLSGAFLTTSLAEASASAFDRTWACEVLLCASNPGGWMQLKERVPPIRKLITHLGLGGSVPTCRAGGVRKADYIKPKNVWPGYVVMTMQDGTQTRYAVPTSSQVDQAGATAQPGLSFGSGTLERK